MDENKTTTTNVRDIKMANVQITCPSCGRSYNDQPMINILTINDLDIKLVGCSFCGEWACLPRTNEMFLEKSVEQQEDDLPPITEYYNPGPITNYSMYGVSLRNPLDHSMYLCPKCLSVMHIKYYKKTRIPKVKECPICGAYAYFPDDPRDWTVPRQP